MAEGTAYEISTPEQLATLAALVNEGDASYNDKYYKLTDDIDLSAYGKNWNNGKGWVPIGSGIQPFYGTFDGNGHVVTGLYINDIDRNYMGLFGVVYGGEVRDLGVAGANIKGKANTGGVAGYVDSNSKVTNCYATSAVSGVNFIGGVAGYVNFTGSKVNNCAALNPSVKGSGANVGRVAGIYTNGGALADNVAFGGMFDILGSTAWSNKGATDLDGEDKSTSDLQAITGFPGGAGVFDTTPWTYTAGKLPSFSSTTPVDMSAHINANGSFFAGLGTSASPFLIYTAAELEMLATFVNTPIAPYTNAGVYYRLTADIDLSGYTSGAGWTPIGINGSSFKGSFNGDGHTVSGLYINNTANGFYAGLFGSVAGSIENLGLISPNVTGGGISSATGGLTGVAAGAIQNCYVLGGSITGANNTGGLAGTSYGAITGCFSTAQVNGDSNVGGLVGVFGSGSPNTMQNCYATGAVIGLNNVGGLVGMLGGSGIDGTITRCYATGAVYASSTTAGGVVGNISSSNGSSVTYCAALNPSVYAQASGAGRVAGNLVLGGTLTNNRTFNGMTDGGGAAFSGANTVNGADGADMNKANAITPAFWTGTMNWATPPWTFTQDKLPTINAAAQNGDPGIYLTQLPPDPVTPPVNPPLTLQSILRVETVTVAVGAAAEQSHLKKPWTLK